MSNPKHPNPDSQTPSPLTEEEEGAEAIISPQLERENSAQPDSNSDPTIKNH